MEGSGHLCCMTPIVFRFLGFSVFHFSRDLIQQRLTFQASSPKRRLPNEWFTMQLLYDIPELRVSQAMLRGKQEAGSRKQRGRDFNNDNAKTHFTCAVYHGWIS
jgi:hypothetical protein